MAKFLIVGLGNIGEEYLYTRHNIGFLVADAIAKKFEVSFKTERLAAITEFKHKSHVFILIKPTTYMNLSGKAVQYWMTKEKINSENIIVVTDDLALPFGTLRLKGKGSDGGHNGLKDIQTVLNTTNYSRLRFGIGNEFNKGSQVNYVLGKWDKEEESKLQERTEKAAEMCLAFGTIGLQLTMTNYNGK
jgi:peptidyl-tRNA hydrolase, PTH1 family